MNDTTCKDCIFAKYKNITQTKCTLGRIEEYKKHGIQVIEAYDEEKEFFVIKNKICMFKRLDDWTHKNKSKNEQIKIIKDKIFPYMVIIINEHNDVSKVIKTLKSVYKQKFLPKYISVINKCETAFNKNNDKKIIELFKANTIPWKLEGMTDPNIPEHKLEDYVVDFRPSYYYSVFYSGFEVPPTMFLKLRNKIIDENLQFSVILPNSQKQGRVVSTLVYKIYNGNKHNKSLVDKLKEKKCPMLTINEVIPCFPK